MSTTFQTALIGLLSLFMTRCALSSPSPLDWEMKGASKVIEDAARKHVTLSHACHGDDALAAAQVEAREYACQVHNDDLYELAHLESLIEDDYPNVSADWVTHAWKLALATAENQYDCNNGLQTACIADQQAQADSSGHRQEVETDEFEFALRPQPAMSTP